MVDYDEALYDLIVDANLKMLFCSQMAAKHMMEQGTGSHRQYIIASRVVGAQRGGLIAVPRGVNNMTRTMAAEWAEHGIRVNVVAPTVTRSPMAEQAMSDSQAFSDAVKTKNLLRGELAEPEEISAPVIFLASPAASMITGHTLVVDGGWTIV